MALFPATPSLRARVLPRFPANVLAGTGISITKNGNVYVFATNLSAVPLTALQPIPTDSLLGRDTAGTGTPEVIGLVAGIGFDGLGHLGLTNNQRMRQIEYDFFNNGAALTTGIKTDIFIPYAFTIERVTLLADQNTGGTAFVIDIWKDTFANYPPTVADTITAAAKPTIASGQNKGQISTLTNWITAVAAGDSLRLNIDTTSTVTRVHMCIEGRAT